ncbi:YidC/Oxa1 family membrane protein insertase [Candidatus Saccharibacteria bacterium]|nr:YidC/Oxa1 family membrane protein insertase [Candidatus Saccharibacteria bacterium]
MGNILNAILIQPLLNLLIFIYAVLPGHDFGIAVIIMTVLIRLALWPLASKQLHSQKKLQALQPEIAALRKKAGGDKQKENQMLMELYKEKEINPFSACLPVLLQFPFLIALYFVFNQATNDIAKTISNLYGPVQNMPWIKDIAASPNLFKPSLLGIVSMAAPSIALAIFAGVTQFIQVKMISPKAADTKGDPQAQATAMMNYLFPAITVFIAWRLPAALPLYWSVTNIVTIIQQKMIMSQEVEKMEEVKVVKKTGISNVIKQLPARTKPAKAKKSQKK